MSARTAGMFDSGKDLPVPFNEGLDQGGAAVTIDNKEMFLTICNAPDGKGNCDIYYTRFIKGKWQKIENIDKYAVAPLNTQWWESQLTISSDGNTLYFASDRPGGQGTKLTEKNPQKLNKDIYKSTRNAAGL